MRATSGASLVYPSFSSEMQQKSTDVSWHDKRESLDSEPNLAVADDRTIANIRDDRKHGSGLVDRQHLDGLHARMADVRLLCSSVPAYTRSFRASGRCPDATCLAWRPPWAWGWSTRSKILPDSSAPIWWGGCRARTHSFAIGMRVLLAFWVTAGLLFALKPRNLDSAYTPHHGVRATGKNASQSRQTIP